MPQWRRILSTLLVEPYAIQPKGGLPPPIKKRQKKKLRSTYICKF